jgi:hypothetical protein
MMCREINQAEQRSPVPITISSKHCQDFIFHPVCDAAWPKLPSAGAILATEACKDNTHKKIGPIPTQKSEIYRYPLGSRSPILNMLGIFTPLLY